jgi:hypothetical protein
MSNVFGIAARRVAAFAVDWLLIAAWGAILFAVVWLLNGGALRAPTNAWIAQAIGFGSMTLPVTMYFAIFESSPLRASLGKRCLGFRGNAGTPSLNMPFRPAKIQCLGGFGDPRWSRPLVRFGGWFPCLRPAKRRTIAGRMLASSSPRQCVDCELPSTIAIWLQSVHASADFAKRLPRNKLAESLYRIPFRCNAL